MIYQKEILCNYCNLVAILSGYSRIHFERPSWYDVVGKELFDWMNTVKLDDFRMLQQPVRN